MRRNMGGLPEEMQTYTSDEIADSCCCIVVPLVPLWCFHVFHDVQLVGFKGCNQSIDLETRLSAVCQARLSAVGYQPYPTSALTLFNLSY